MERDARVGFIARCDDTGLGVESADFVRHYRPAKVLKAIVGRRNQHPDRFAGSSAKADSHGWIPNAAIEKFCEDIDVLYAIETPYNPYAFSIARRRGVKSALRINFEYLDPLVGMNRPDLFISPVDWMMEYVPQPNMILASPVDTKRIRARKIEWARTFVHVEGNGGYMDRNGTDVVMQAIPLMKSKAKIVIYSQRKPRRSTAARLEWRGAAERPEDLYRDGDVLLYPRRHSGQSLLVNEAQAAGMPVMMTDMAPLNVETEPELRIPVKRMLGIDIKRRIEYAEIDPAALAEKVDALYDQNIWEFSEAALRRATKKSWTTLLPKYRQMFSRL